MSDEVAENTPQKHDSELVKRLLADGWLNRDHVSHEGLDFSNAGQHPVLQNLARRMTIEKPYWEPEVGVEWTETEIEGMDKSWKKVRFIMDTHGTAWDKSERFNLRFDTEAIKNRDVKALFSVKHKEMFNKLEAVFPDAKLGYHKRGDKTEPEAIEIRLPDCKLPIMIRESFTVSAGTDDWEWKQPKAGEKPFELLEDFFKAVNVVTFYLKEEVPKITANQ
jgi:hypothetical protein